MKLKVDIKNFGKVRDARLKLAPFTVIAGANSSGKSFVSRALYSFFSTINKDHVTDSSVASFDRIRDLLFPVLSTVKNPSLTVVLIHEGLVELLIEIENTLEEELGSCTFLEQKSRLTILNTQINKFESMLNGFRLETEGKKKYEELSSRLFLIQQNLRGLIAALESPLEILSDNIEKGFREALTENFQTPNLSDLRSFESEDSEITFDFGDFGKITILDESIGFSLNTESVDQFQSLFNVVFIESPIYWKLRKPLLRLMEKPRFLWSRRHYQESLSGVPKYFYDLIELVEKNIKPKSKSIDISNVQNILKDVLGGELEISEGGDIFYKHSNSHSLVNLNLTATGVTNLGVIGLLLKRNVIAKGSFIFIDEPEVNLHPAWQKIMVDVLYKLSTCGVNIVITSHSIDMMKYIENIMESLEDEQLLKHFAINRLSNTGVSTDVESPPLQALAKIKEDLGAPFYEMMLESW
ncbi:hypothetical protein CTT31_19305 [Pseudoalteromonas maricaloris]|uniref:AAA family ATPase n=1 Tax=Pseudoalteromonas maricaloris TaxID=184924 RepID=UPI0021AE01E9|nr:AAA family ATPase [Pseudoalteromonas flavipulchra]USE71243.1 hypothetical protein CTT31_19305 [Pseudoalteromonas flavipulchra]